MLPRALVVLFLAMVVGRGADIPFPFPPAPDGTNPAIYASPRFDGWLAVFMARLQKSHGMARTDIIFDGDSITDRWTINGPDTWTAYDKLNAIDFGISGDRTEHLLWRLRQGQVDGLHPKLIFLMIGTNNILEGVDSNEQIAAGVKAILDEYRKRCPEAVIVLQGMPPCGPQPNTGYRTHIRDINALISKFADGKSILWIDFGDKFLQPDGTLTAEMMPDYLHPSAKAYQIWAGEINPIINKYIPGANLPAPTKP